MKKIIASTLIAVGLLASLGSAANAAHGYDIFAQLQQDGS